MFERLDDPNPPSPEPGSCARVIGRARRRRQRRHRRVAASATGAVAVGVLAVAGFFVTEGRRLDQVAHVDVATQPSAVPDVQTILVVGTDRGLAPGDVPAAADSIAAVRIDGSAHTATVLAIPRDLAITDASSGTPAKVSDLFRANGPAGLVTSIKAALGVEINHYIQVDPAGFEALIDSTGGLKLRSSAALRDTHSGLLLDGGSCTPLDGATALALARSRWTEIHDGSSWVPGDQGDIGRMQRESVLGRALFASLQAANLHNPVAIDHLVDTFVSHVTVDSGLHRDDLIDLVRTVRTIPADAVTVTGLPVTIASQGPVSALGLADGWKSTVEKFAAGRAPSGVEAAPQVGGVAPRAGEQSRLELC